jgi:hypothetical protein
MNVVKHCTIVICRELEDMCTPDVKADNYGDIMCNRILNVTLPSAKLFLKKIPREITTL